MTVGNSRSVVGPIADRTVPNGVTDTVDVEVADADPEDGHMLTASSDDNATALAYPMGGRVNVRALHGGTATVKVTGIARGRTTATDGSGAANDTSAPPPTFGVLVASAGNSRPVVGPIGDVELASGATGTVAVTVADADDAHTVTAMTACAASPARDGTSPSPTIRCSLHARVPAPGWEFRAPMRRVCRRGRGQAPPLGCPAWA